MTDLAIPEPQNRNAVAPVAAEPAVAQSSITEWAHEADLAFQLANRLSETSFVPASMKGRPGDITACLLAGNELGLRPMAALKSMDVIQGTPALRANAMRGLIQNAGHEIELIESTSVLCRMRGRRKGSETWQEVVWPIARAAQLGLTGKAEWKKQPQTMLVARATGEICRLIASDVLHAVPYNTEELRDHPKTTVVRVGSPVSAAEILGTAPTPPAADEYQQPDPEPEPPQAEPEPQAQPQLTNWQIALNNVAAVANEIGWDRPKTEAEFSRVNNGLAIGDAAVEDLDAFAEYMRTVGGAE